MRVLLADDERLSRGLFGEWLGSWGYEVTPVSDGAEALAALSADPSLRLAIVDWVMPVLDGIDVCRVLRSRTREPHVYVILLTARDNKADVVQGLDAGADDYLVKPFDPLELEVRLRAGRRVIELQGQLIEARETLRLEAMRDALTGLLNRRALLERMQEELARAERRSTPVTSLMIDIDHFKRINDAFGRAVGDEVLREVGRRLRVVVRNYDVVGRLGGEEFLVLAPDCDVDRGLLMARRVTAALGQTPIATRAGAIALTVSIGVASTRQEPGRPEEIVRASDSALYRAKRAGRDRIEIAQRSDWEPAPVSSLHAMLGQ